jgi:hypothetical protein
MADPPSVQDRQLLGQYAEALEPLEARYSSIIVKGLHTTEKANGTATHKKLVEYVSLERGGNGRKCTTTRKGESGADGPFERVVSKNRSQSFILDRATEGARYELKHIAGPDDSSVNKSLSVSFRFINSLYSCQGIPMKTLMSDPGFRALSVAADGSGGNRSVKVRFELKSDRKEVNFAMMKSGSFVVLPAQGWVIRELDCSMKGALEGVENSMRIEYDAGLDGIARPRMFVDRRGENVVHTFEVESISFEDPPAEHFTLESYGFPTLDAPGAPARRNNLVPWLVGLAVLALAAAAALRIYVRRSSLPRAA